MSSYDEVASILSALGVLDNLEVDEKIRVSKEIHEKLPLSLELMSCFDDELPSIDIDEWHSTEKVMHEKLISLLGYNAYYLFVKAFPKNFMLTLDKNALASILFHEEFCYPFAVFSKDLASFIMEDDSGEIIACGDFGVLLKQA